REIADRLHLTARHPTRLTAPRPEGKTHEVARPRQASALVPVPVQRRRRHHRRRRRPPPPHPRPDPPRHPADHHLRRHGHRRPRRSRRPPPPPPSAGLTHASPGQGARPHYLRGRALRVSGKPLCLAFSCAFAPKHYRIGPAGPAPGPIRAEAQLSCQRPSARVTSSAAGAVRSAGPTTTC